jgi:hypothetical protein
MDEKFSELTLNGGFGDDLNVSKTKSFPVTPSPLRS